MKITIDFFDISQKDFKYLEKAIDEEEYKRIMKKMIKSLRNGNYEIKEVMKNER